MITHRFTMFDDNWTACFEITVKAVNILEHEIYSSSHFQKPTLQDFMMFSVLFDLLHETIRGYYVQLYSSEYIEWYLWISSEASASFSKAPTKTNKRLKHGDVYLPRIQHNRSRCLIGFSTKCIHQTEWCQSLWASLFWVQVGIASLNVFQPHYSCLWLDIWGSWPFRDKCALVILAWMAFMF